eukprot:GFYU01002136.1.p1 GENE.GFYU01002136.1~~GFYU01002136.1.p1  ORF type:complete len:307 (-),score=126.93 GFYU01002136.1:266-1186(-)
MTMGDNNKEYAFPQELVIENVSPATHLLEKRRQMFEVQEALDAQKDEFARKEEGFKKREEQLKKRDIELQESLIKFNKFLQENEAKCQRANKKAQDEKHQMQMKEIEIGELKTEIQRLEYELKKNREALKKDMRYQQYLLTVVDFADQFEDVGAIESRHITLKKAKEDLQSAQDNNLAQIEATNKELNEFKSRKTNESLVLNSQIAVLKKKYEEAVLRGLELQSIYEQKYESAEKKNLELGMIINATDHVFRRLCHTEGLVNPKAVNMNGDTFYQLGIICQYLQDLLAIVKSKMPKKFQAMNLGEY